EQSMFATAYLLKPSPKLINGAAASLVSITVAQQNNSGLPEQSSCGSMAAEALATYCLIATASCAPSQLSGVKSTALVPLVTDITEKHAVTCFFPKVCAFVTTATLTARIATITAKLNLNFFIIINF